MKSGHPARQGQKGRDIQDRLTALIVAELREDAGRHLVLDRDRKQRAKDHIGGGMAGFLLDLDRVRHLHPGVQPGHRRFCRLPHGGKGVTQPAPLEGRIDDAPLPFPCRPVGQKDRIVQQRAQAFGHAHGFRKIPGPVLQDKPDKVRLIGQHGPKEGRAKIGHPGPVEARRLGRQYILPEQAHVAQQRHAFRADSGFGRQRCHGATVT